MASRTVVRSLILLCFAGLGRPSLEGGQGTLLVLQNPTNSSPRMASMWGGGGSEQIIMKSDGSVWTWGLNGEGQLGNGTTNNADSPGQVLGPNGLGYLGPVSAIMGGEIHNFALKPDGTVWSWGWNIFGQLGDGSSNWGYGSNYTTTPVRVFGLTSVKSLGGRGYHSMALRNDGTVWTWGCNRNGELGIGLIFSGPNFQGTNTPVQVLGLTNPASLSGGGFFSLALMPDGTVRSWGANASGQCGNGSNNDCATVVQVLGLTNILGISGGWTHALALKSDGTVWSWGSNGNGELGDGTSTNRSTPVQVVGLSNIVSVSTGDQNSMALRTDGTVWKWGENQFGELGNGTSDNGSIVHPLPLQVPGLSNVVIGVCRDYHNICVKRDGTVWVWGDNRYGGCGDFTGNSVLSPRLMPGLVTNNLLPYSESFESYHNGFSIVGTNNWQSDSPGAAVVVATNYPYSGAYPIPGPHTLALNVSGTVTNLFLPSFYSNLWMDLIVQASPLSGPLPVLSNASFAVCVTSNGTLAVWNRTNPPAPGNGWTQVLDSPDLANQFCRLTIGVNYSPDTNGLYYYNLWINGVPSTNPASRYAAADSSQPWLGQLVASGAFILDDLVVGTNKSFYALMTSSTGYGGAVAPGGATIVLPGATNTFSIISSNWYYLSSVLVDGANVPTNGSFTFTDVQADHTLVANFAPYLAAHNTPEWWLYQQNTNWATNFDAAALGDQDGDGMPTWAEYIAGTDPQNASSVFSLSAAPANGLQVFSFQTVPTTPQYQAHRYYALQSSTNLLPSHAWQSLPGWTNVFGSGQYLTYTNLVAQPSQFFRGQVWLGP